MKTYVNNRDITIGTDVEVGLYHYGAHVAIPATAFNTPYDKATPEPIMEKTDYGKSLTQIGTFHRDNITVEFQSLPADSPHALQANLLAINQALLNMYSDSMGCTLLYRPCIYYRDPEMVQVPEAQEVGCDPDFCAYQNGAEQPTALASSMGMMRTCSGHVHIGGISDMTDAMKHSVVQWMDMLAGVPFSQYDAYHDAYAYKRRKYYGQPGRFRYKPYGVECRTFSNAWVGRVIELDEQVTPALFRAVGRAVDAVDQELLPEGFFDVALMRDACLGVDASGYGEPWPEHIEEVVAHTHRKSMNKLLAQVPFMKSHAYV